jgi:heme o synthase
LKIKSHIFSYFQLMKPSIMLLVLVTGATSLVLEGSVIKGIQPVGLYRFSLILLSLLLTGGSANAFNMYLERDIDSQMTRTRNKRPLPLGKITPTHALIYAIVIGILGVLIFAVYFNILSAILALSTILFYSFFYTLYLKPRTPYNIVIGGAAGSMAPIIAWAAVSGHLTVTPIILFAIIFLWTPPHFWSLALYLKKDYELVSYPMMPISRGDKSTKRQIFFYVLILVIFSGVCLVFGAGKIYAFIAILGGVIFIYKSLKMLRSATTELAYSLFGYSIIYLFAIFTGLAIDSLLKV